MLKTPASFSAWFYTAAVYNLLSGAVTIGFPSGAHLLGMADANPALIQCIGMMVGVYAYGYYLIARAPVRYSGLVWVGLAGKTFGPIGFLYYAITGGLPWAFGFVCLFNDLIWWPVFWMFALRYARKPL